MVWACRDLFDHPKVGGRRNPRRWSHRAVNTSMMDQGRSEHAGAVTMEQRSPTVRDVVFESFVAVKKDTNDGYRSSLVFILR